uniref:Uncharacterized protein n=1 Tax=Vespula pensylvanica TaxID=30213 RepID=A0A834P2N6_VESPE|nr:hypothetical protein H0235_008153 [Vespula pensylvanica]
MQGINCASRDNPRLFQQGYVSVTPETPSTTKSNGTPSLPSCSLTRTSLKALKDSWDLPPPPHRWRT